MDLSTLIGVIAGIVLCVFGMVVGQENAMKAISSFLHLPSALITFGGLNISSRLFQIRDYLLYSDKKKSQISLF